MLVVLPTIEYVISVPLLSARSRPPLASLGDKCRCVRLVPYGTVALPVPLPFGLQNAKVRMESSYLQKPFLASAAAIQTVLRFWPMHRLARVP